jgi:hypothetical protein
MPRANRYITAGSIYHVTHPIDKLRTGAGTTGSFSSSLPGNAGGYRSLLREHLHESDVSLLAYRTHRLDCLVVDPTQHIPIL